MTYPRRTRVTILAWVGLGLAAVALVPRAGREALGAAWRVARRPFAAAGWVGQQPDGSTLVPSGQALRPAGQEVTFPGRPVDMALSPDGKTLAVLNGTNLLLLDVSPPVIRQTLAAPAGGHSFAGLAWSPDGRRLFASGVRGGIQVLAVRDGVAAREPAITIPDLPAVPRRRPATPEELESQPPGLRSNSVVPGGMAVSADGRRLYVALNRANTLAEIDVEGGRLLRQIPVGVAPYGVLLSPDGKTAFVTNWGGRRPAAGELAAYSSGTPVTVDPATGIASTGTVSVVDLARGSGEEITVGLHPCAMARSGDILYVANAGSDSITSISIGRRAVLETTPVRPRPDLPPGSSPIGLASMDGLLLAANAGNNAVAVLAPADRPGPGRERRAVRGLVPAGWYPSAIVPVRGGQAIAVANLKGLGSRNPPAKEGAHTVRDFLGSVTIIDASQLRGDSLAAATRTVSRNNRWDVLDLAPARSGAARVPVPGRVGEPSDFKHVLYIIKENRTYDQVFGDIREGNGDPSLVQFGEEVTPNHHALAREFVLLDNLYCSGTVSADGHQWTNEAYANDYLERFLGAGFPRSYPYEGSDPLAYASTGFLWDNPVRGGMTFRCYGEFAQTLVSPATSWTAFWQDRSKADRIRSATYVRSLKPFLHPGFPGFAMGIPDQVRADIFLRELKEFEAKGQLPRLMIMLLPDDHTSGVNPGQPTPRAMVGDNDLALGRIVEGVSRSRFWSDTCIFVVEDDAQNGTDHVDGHRTVSLVVSPYTRRGAVVSETYTQVSIVATIERILGLSPMNQLDHAAPLMTACFASRPDPRPYTTRPNRIPLDEMNPPARALTPERRKWVARSLEQDFSQPDAADEDVLNRILWHSTRGWNQAYPARGPR